MRRHRLATALAICTLPLALVACGEKPVTDPRTEIPQVRVAIVDELDAASRSFTGTVAARVQSDLGFRVAGKVLERQVDAGQSVRRSQLLMRIDPIDLRLAAQAQLEAVAAARAKAQQTAEDEARYRELRGSGAISVSAYDQIKAAADAARAQLSAAEAQADIARNASRYAELVADADGIVMETLAEPGQVINPGQIVVRLAHAGRREAVIQLPETLRPTLGSTGQATLFGSDSTSKPAKLRQLSHTADRLTRTYEARYVLDGDLANAPLGATVTVQLHSHNHSGKSGLQVPLGALFDAGNGPGVWVVQGQPAKVYWRPVTIQRLSDEGAQVSGQVRQGEKIVALGAHLLREGQLVRMLETPAKTSVDGGRL